MTTGRINQVTIVTNGGRWAAGEARERIPSHTPRALTPPPSTKVLKVHPKELSTMGEEGEIAPECDLGLLPSSSLKGVLMRFKALLMSDTKIAPFEFPRSFKFLVEKRKEAWGGIGGRFRPLAKKEGGPEEQLPPMFFCHSVVKFSSVRPSK